MKRLLIFSLILLMVSIFGVWFFRSKAIIKAQTVNPTPTPSYDSSEWFMAGANPQRTSHVDSTPENQTEIPGKLYPEWFIPIEPYIPYGWQLIIADDTIFVSTARGLYAIDINAGDLYNQNPNDPTKPWIRWIFPTELPLGQSPTVVKNSQGEYIVYVGGFDKKVHAIKATPDPSKVEIDPLTSQRVNKDIVWTFDAQEYWNNTEPQVEHIAAGFNTNPLVIDNKVFLGNRDGYMYALDATDGNLLWHFKTGGPILFSAATSPDNSIIYFASNDMHGYAVRASDGKLDAQTIPGTWKTTKFPGSGFYSWWPVYYHHPLKGDRVIFSGSNNYRADLSPGAGGHFTTKELTDFYTPAERVDTGPLSGIVMSPLENVPGDWVPGTVTMDAQRASAYLRTYPDRRTYFVVQVIDGQEETYDFEGSGNADEYAPVLWAGTHSGARFPPIIGPDNVLYQQNNYVANPSIAGGGITGWVPGSSTLSILEPSRVAVDEPQGYAMGGTIVYYNHINDFHSGSINTAIPNTKLQNTYDPVSKTITFSAQGTNKVSYFTNTIASVIPGFYTYTNYQGVRTFGGNNGIYQIHGNQNPPIPYKGHLYYQLGNSIIRFTPETGKTVFPVSKISTVSVNSSVTSVPSTNIQKRLGDEISRMIAAGPLRPGYIGSGILNFTFNNVRVGDDLLDYWHHPFDTVYPLLRAYSYVDNNLQDEIKTYLDTNYFNVGAPYDITNSNHIGWDTGEGREYGDLPLEVMNDLHNHPSQQGISGFNGWVKNPQRFYAIWQYAKVFNLSQQEVQTLFTRAKNKPLNQIPADDILLKRPYVVNAYIAGYYGYMQLEELSGLSPSASIVDGLNHLVSFRADHFSKDTPFTGEDPKDYRINALNISQNFLYLVPKLSEYMATQDPALHRQFTTNVADAVNYYNTIGPSWFVSQWDSTYSEGVIAPLYDYHSLFQARAQILHEPFEELVKYLDVPAVERGDLFYIDNLVSLLEAPSTGITVSPTPNGSGSPTPTSTPSTPGDTDGDTDVDIFDYNAVITDFGKTGELGFSVADFDGDGDVDIFDYNVVISNFGR